MANLFLFWKKIRRRKPNFFQWVNIGFSGICWKHSPPAINICLKLGKKISFWWRTVKEMLLLYLYFLISPLLILLGITNLAKLNLPACGCTAVVALMAIKTELEDPHNVLDNWDINSVDPCSWRMVTCSADGYVSALYVMLPCSCPFPGAPTGSALCRSSYMFFVTCRGLPSQSLSGKLSPGIGNLTRLQSV